MLDFGNYGGVQTKSTHILRIVRNLYIARQTKMQSLWEDSHMDILEWLQANTALVSLVSTIILLIINGIYIYLTKKTLDITVRQSNLVSNPVIGIRLGKMGISSVFGPSRRNLSIGLNLVNVGSAPAIEVLVDAEIVLQYSNIQNEKTIPARYEPASISFIRPSEEIPENGIHDPSFGNTCITHLLDDFRERKRLNTLRIETDPTKDPYDASMLRVCIYYQNNLSQYFESVYEVYLHLEKLPKDDETAELSTIYIPRPKFHAGPISKEKMDKEISYRNTKRDLCGW
jgi:hypothetical protein